jgi:hypothetical protein
MAIEELVFFVVIPTCGLLTIEAVRNILSGRVRLRPLPIRDQASSSSQ